VEGQEVECGAIKGRGRATWRAVGIYNALIIKHVANNTPTAFSDMNPAESDRIPHICKNTFPTVYNKPEHLKTRGARRISCGLPPASWQPPAIFTCCYRQTTFLSLPAPYATSPIS
jgi:hypothetical protein